MDELVFPTPRSTVAPADRQSLSLDGSSLVGADEKGNPPHSLRREFNGYWGDDAWVENVVYPIKGNWFVVWTSLRERGT